MTDYQATLSSDQLTPMNPSQNPSNPLEVSPSDNFNGTNPSKTLIKRSSDFLGFCSFYYFFYDRIIYDCINYYLWYEN